MNDETAKAVQEVAKTTGQLIQASEKAGTFMAKYIDGPAQEVSLILQDRLKFFRAEQFLKMRDKLNRLLGANGAPVQLKALPLGFAMEAIEQSVIEESDELQEIWARLIANAADAASGVEPRRSYITILKDFTPFDARIFSMIYGLTHTVEQLIYTGDLPTSASTRPKANAGTLNEPPDQVKGSLSNLARLGLLSFAQTYSGAEVYNSINQTYAGRDLMRALTRKA